MRFTRLKFFNITCYRISINFGHCNSYNKTKQTQMQHMRITCNKFCAIMILFTEGPLTRISYRQVFQPSFVVFKDVSKCKSKCIVRMIKSTKTKCACHYTAKLVVFQIYWIIFENNVLSNVWDCFAVVGLRNNLICTDLFTYIYTLLHVRFADFSILIIIN